MSGEEVEIKKEQIHEQQTSKKKVGTGAWVELGIGGDGNVEV